MGRRLAQLFAVVFAFSVLASAASECRAQNPLPPEQVLELFVAVESAIDKDLKAAEAARLAGQCSNVSSILDSAELTLQTFTPDKIGASGHARLSARVAAARRAPCPPPGGSNQRPTAQPGDKASDALGPRSRASEREDVRELIEGAFAAAEAARLKGDCVRWGRQLGYLSARVSKEGRYGEPASKLFPEPVKLEWQERLREFRGRPCPPPKPPESTPVPTEPTPAETSTVAKDGAVQSSPAKDTPPPTPPPPPVPTGTLGDLRVALAKSCGAQFEPARAALLAGIDRAILTAAGDPKRLATLVEDRAYIAGLPVTPCPPSPLMTGTFITNFGTMVLVDGRGTYTDKNGRVTPTRIEGVMLEATWEQSESARRCTDGRFRGKLTFNFSQNGFAGSWGYCDEAPTNAWSGQRR